MLEYIKVIAPLLTAIVGMVVAIYVAKKQFRAAVLSKNRQEWINSLRDDLAEFHSLIFNVYADITSGGIVYPDDSDKIKAFARARHLSSRVSLFLNYREEDHNKLRGLMKKLNELVTFGEKYSEEIGDLNVQFLALSQKILKDEWERVKKAV